MTSNRPAPSGSEGRLREALERLHRSIHALAKVTKHHETGISITLFEASPLKDQQALDAWAELDRAQKQAAEALALAEQPPVTSMEEQQSGRDKSRLGCDNGNAP